MEQKKKLAHAKWIAGGCVALALIGAVVFLRREKAPASTATGTAQSLSQAAHQIASVDTNSLTMPQTQPTIPSSRTEQEQNVGETEPFLGNMETEITSEWHQLQEQVQRIDFPYALDEGRLLIQSLFQYTGVNPDAGDQMGENVAGLVVSNVSDRHLSYAQIEVRLTEEITACFQIQDLPSGASVMVFSDANQPIGQTDGWLEIHAETVFADGSPMLEDMVTVSENGTKVTLTNLTQQELKDLSVHCHCVLNSEYFAGKTYCYQVDVLPAGGSVEIDAWECYLGQAEIVRIVRNEEGA